MSRDDKTKRLIPVDKAGRTGMASKDPCMEEVVDTWRMCMDSRVAADMVADNAGSNTWNRAVIEEMGSRDVLWDTRPSFSGIVVRWVDKRIPGWTDVRRSTREWLARPPESAAGNYNRAASVDTGSHGACCTGNSCAFSRWISGRRADSRTSVAKLGDICIARSSRTERSTRDPR